MASQRIKITIAYDGTNYAGWQNQPKRPTIQRSIINAVEEITGESIRAHASGRTDAGVHAKGQVAHFDVSHAPDIRRFQRGLNALLPDDIRIMRLQKVSDDWHARYSAKGKEYRYFIYNRPVMPPALRLYRTHYLLPLDVKAMQEAAASLVGVHDYSSFSARRNQNDDDRVREVSLLEVKKSGAEIMIRTQGKGYLYKMVRSFAGFLIKVGVGDLQVEDARKLLALKERTAKVPTAAAKGLFLWKVFYD